MRLTVSSVSLIADKQEPGRIGAITLDATLADSHHFSNEITEYPVENGSNINDHIKRNPFEVSISGFITNSPVDFASDISSVTIDEIIDNKAKNLNAVTSNRVKGSFLELTRIIGENLNSTVYINKPKVVTIVTSLYTYKNMVMTSLSIDRNPSQGDALLFTATFRPFNKVESKRTIMPKLVAGDVGEGSGTSNITDQASETVDTGSQTPKRLKSIAKRIGESDVAKNLGDKIKSLVEGL
jgi:hypothetical protein